MPSIPIPAFFSLISAVDIFMIPIAIACRFPSAKSPYKTDASGEMRTCEWFDCASAAHPRVASARPEATHHYRAFWHIVQCTPLRCESCTRYAHTGV
jgi:hypothetical protein